MNAQDLKRPPRSGEAWTNAVLVDRLVALHAGVLAVPGGGALMVIERRPVASFINAGMGHSPESLTWHGRLADMASLTEGGAYETLATCSHHHRSVTAAYRCAQQLAREAGFITPLPRT